MGYMDIWDVDRRSNQHKPPPAAAAVSLVGVAYIVFILGCPFLGDRSTSVPKSQNAVVLKA
jgi:hypothetical protein